MARNFRNNVGKKFFDESWIWDNTFHRIVTDRHYFRKYDAWGLATSTLEELQKRGVEKIEIIHRGKKVRYCTTVGAFMKRGTRGSFGGNEEQRFLYVCPANYETLPLVK